MPDFEGITNKYRESDEYKTFMKHIKEEHPKLPLYLAEMAISAHKMDPQAYKQLEKNESKYFNSKKEEKRNEYNLVKIYANEEEFKKSQEILNEK